MKRIILSLALFALLLTGCGAKSAEKQTITYGEAEIALDAKAGEVFAALGLPENVSRKPSCAFSGDEITYRYPELCIQTYPGRDGERIAAFWFTGSSPATNEGISIGSDAEAVFAAYGIRESGTLPWGSGKLTIVIGEGKVESIQFSLV